MGFLGRYRMSAHIRELRSATESLHEATSIGFQHRDASAHGRRARISAMIALAGVLVALVVIVAAVK